MLIGKLSAGLDAVSLLFVSSDWQKWIRKPFKGATFIVTLVLWCTLCKTLINDSLHLFFYESGWFPSLPLYFFPLFLCYHLLRTKHQGLHKLKKKKSLLKATCSHCFMCQKIRWLSHIFLFPRAVWYEEKFYLSFFFCHY